MVPARVGHRRILVAASLAGYFGLVFVGLTRVEVPGLGLGHLLYLPIAALALATGPVVGAGAGVAATVVYLVGAAVNPHLASSDGLTYLASVIRFVTFVGIGWLVGSAAAHNRALMQRLQQHAERDFLTDLLNSRAFESALTNRLDTERPFVLALADVDDLKVVNDSQGHPAGDDYLRRLASVLREETSPQDSVARIGGDEFAVLTDLQGPADAEAFCRRLQNALAGRGISASFGYAAFPAEGGDRLALFHAADKRLYQGKPAGTERRLRSVS